MSSIAYRFLTVALVDPQRDRGLRCESLAQAQLVAAAFGSSVVAADATFAAGAVWADGAA